VLPKELDDFVKTIRGFAGRQSASLSFRRSVVDGLFVDGMEQCP
jgi:hypothetical protein